MPANRELAESKLEQAEGHVASAELVKDTDATGALQFVYDGARMASAAILVNQGLRFRGSTHLPLDQAVVARLNPPPGEAFRQFGWMRPPRNNSECPDPGRPLARIAEVEQAIPAGR